MQTSPKLGTAECRTLQQKWNNKAINVWMELYLASKCPWLTKEECFSLSNNMVLISEVTRKSQEFPPSTWRADWCRLTPKDTRCLDRSAVFLITQWFLYQMKTFWVKAFLDFWIYGEIQAVRKMVVVKNIIKTKLQLKRRRNVGTQYWFNYYNHHALTNSLVVYTFKITRMSEKKNCISHC